MVARDAIPLALARTRSRNGPRNVSCMPIDPQGRTVS